MVEFTQGSSITGGPSVPSKAPKGKRFAAAFVDLFIIPLILGFVAGFILLAAPDALRTVLLVVLNIAWMVVKDLLWDGAAPGKKMVGLKVISVETGGKITLAQAFIRNVLLIIPFVLFIGYPLEIVMMFVGERFGDKWAKTAVVES